MDYLDRNHRALLELLLYTCNRFDNFAMPMKYNNHFDVIGIKDDKCYRIRVVCTESKQPSGAYIANLIKSGATGSSLHKKEHFNPSSCEWLFVWTPEKKYLIPSKRITQKKAITLSGYEEFIIVPS